MEGQRHPITVGRPVAPHAAVAQKRRPSASRVATSPASARLPGAKINGRPGDVHRGDQSLTPRPPIPRGSQMARIFIDQKLNLPIRYEQYDWSGVATDKPRVGRAVHLPRSEIERRPDRRGFRPAEPEVQFSVIR